MSAPAQWQRIEELYYDALEVPETERPAFLVRACAGDEVLRREVESLLAARAEAGGFLSQAALERSLLNSAQRAALNARLGSSIGHYQLLSILGVGGMGEVFLAEDTRLHRQVALKLLPPQFSQQPGRVRRFEQEARATTALNHPNIVTLYDTGQHEGSYFIVNEFVDGQTLRDYLNEKGALPISKALNIAQQIATALAAAHAAGIVHRDIKPENVMLRRDGFVKVLDFGLAKLTDAAPEPVRDETQDDDNPQAALRHPQSQTAAGALLGTIRYMSPEQARGIGVDARTDVFSLGIVLYEMLTGRTPFHRETATETLAAILEAEPAALPETIPLSLRRLLANALRKDQTQRLQTTDEFAAALRGLLDEAQFSTRLAGMNGWRFWLRRWPVWVGALLLVGVALWFWKQPRGSFESEVLPNLRSLAVDEWKVGHEASQFGIRFSPDDQQLVFSKSQAGSTDIFVESARGGARLRLTQDAWEDANPIWSPDGKQISYLSTRGSQKELWQVPSQGGAGKQLAVFPRPFATGTIYLICWSQDGQRLYFVAQCNVYTFEPATNKFTNLTNFPTAPCTFNYADLSADEQWLTYHQGNSGTRQIWALKLNDGAPQQLTHEGEDNSYPIFHPDGQRVLYISKRNGVGQICVASLDGRTPTQITFSHEDMELWDLARDGQRLLYTTSNNEADLYRYDLSTGSELRVSGGRNLELSPTIAPDGQTFAYQQAAVTGKLATSALWLQPPALGAPPVRLVEDAFDPHWSPQQARLAFLRQGSKRLALWTVQPDGSGLQPLVAEGLMPGGYMPFPFRWSVYPNYSWSPDGRQLAYCSVKSGSPNVWTISSNGADERMVSANANPKIVVGAPLFAPDPRRLAFLTIDRRGLPFQNQFCVAEETTSRVVWELRGRASLLGWSATGQELLVAADESANLQQTGTVKLWRVALATGRATEIAQVTAAYVNSFRLAPTGNQVAYVTRRQERDELWRLTLADGKAKRIHSNDDPLIYFAELAWAPTARALYVSKQSNSMSLWTIENFR